MFNLDIFKVTETKKEFMNSIKNNDVTITVTPTGSGKTQAFPVMSYQAMCELSGLEATAYVVVPRVIMATKSMEYNNSLWDEPNMASYMTGRSGDSENISNSVIRYITEGSFVSRGMHKKINPKTDIVLMDEVHEQNILTEAIMFLMAKQSKENGQKFVVMSATTDPNKFKNYLEKFGLKVGIITIPEQNREFKHEFRIVDQPLKEIANIAKNGGRCLVGDAGKYEIGKTIDILNRYLGNSIDDVEIISYHGSLEEEDDRYAKNLMKTSKKGVIFVGTNIIQSSVTIVDLDAGYFHGLGKRIQSVQGEKSLVDYELSKAEMKQWYGRGGRTKDFTVFLTESDQNDFKERENYPVASILLEPTEGTIIDLLGVGIDLKSEDTLLINMPRKEEINRSWNRLEKLGIIENGKLSDFGDKVRKLPFEIIPAIAAQTCIDYGMEALGHKLGEIISDTPFRDKYSNIRHYTKDLKEYSHSTYALWLMTIEAIREKYGYVIDSLNGNLFTEEMDKMGVHRRIMKRFFKKYNYIDANYVDNEDVSEEFIIQVIDMALRNAFSDRVYTKNNSKIFDDMPYSSVNDAQYSIAIDRDGFNKNKVGTVFVYGRFKLFTANYLMNTNPLAKKARNATYDEICKLFDLTGEVGPYVTPRFLNDKGVSPFEINNVPDLKKTGNDTDYYTGVDGLYFEGDYSNYKYETEDTLLHFNTMSVIINEDHGDKTLRALRKFAIEIGETRGHQFIAFDIHQDNIYFVVYV